MSAFVFLMKALFLFFEFCFLGISPIFLGILLLDFAFYFLFLHHQMNI